MTLRGLVVGFVAGLLGAVALPHPSFANAPDGCVVWNPIAGYCVEWGGGEDDGTSGDTGNGGGRPPVCYWVNIAPIDDPTIYADFGLSIPPPGVSIQWQSWECSDGTPTFNFRWIFDIPPEDIARDVRVRISGQLAEPLVTASPPLGTPSIVKVPVFVAVSNWTGVVTDTGCGGGLCVTVTATPRLTFASGEAGSQPIACAGSGTTFDRSRPPSDQALTSGACVHTYSLRTGIESRPAEWPGSVTVLWSISWVATTGDTGTLPSITRTTALPRAVQEVQTVVVGGSTP